MRASVRPTAHCILALVNLCLFLSGCDHPSAASTSEEPHPAKAAPATNGTAASEAALPIETSDVARAPKGGTDSGSPPAIPKRGKAPPADRQPTRPGDAEKITFDDLNIGMQADVVFRPFMLTDRVKELEGERVSIVGYMHGGALSSRGIHEFVLLKNTECKFGPGGQADHLAQVLLAEGPGTEFTKRPVKVEGRLKLEPFQGPDGNTWSIYRLEEAQIR